MLQEDAPEEFATLVLNFISRNRIGPHGIEVGIHILLPNVVVWYPRKGLWYSTNFDFCSSSSRLCRVSTLEIFLTFKALHRSRLCVHHGAWHITLGKVWGSRETHAFYLEGFLWVNYLLFILTFLIAIYFTIHLFIFCQVRVPSSRVTWRCYKYLLN